VKNPFKRNKDLALPVDIAMFLEQIQENPKPIIDNFSRELLFDSQLQNPLQIARYLDLPPISAELEEKEREESDKRIAQVEWLIPMFGAISHFLADALIAECVAKQDEENLEIDPEFWEALHNRLETFGISVLLTTMSTLVDIGFVYVGEEDE
jgi:hypothetical protein